MELTCIMCPNGCTLKVTKKGGKIVVGGNACPRGAIYGEKEVTAPERIVTTVKEYKTGTICLKTSKPIPKNMVKDCLLEVKKKRKPTKISLGDTYIKNILKTGADMVVTAINI